MWWWRALTGSAGGTLTVSKPFEVQRKFRALVDTPTLASQVRISAKVSRGFCFGAIEQSDEEGKSTSTTTSSSSKAGKRSRRRKVCRQRAVHRA